MILLNKVEIFCPIKNKVVSTVTTRLLEIIKYPRLPNIHGYQISTVTKYPRLQFVHDYPNSTFTEQSSVIFVANDISLNFSAGRTWPVPVNCG